MIPNLGASTRYSSAETPIFDASSQQTKPAHLVETPCAEHTVLALPIFPSQSMLCAFELMKRPLGSSFVKTQGQHAGHIQKMSNSHLLTYTQWSP